MFRILNFALIAIALVSFLFAPARAQTAYERAHLWEKEINAFAETDKQAKPKSVEVLFVGSSSIRGWRTVAEDFPDFKVLNRGFGGSHLEDVIHYAPRIVHPYKPRLIVLYAGENDLTAGKTVNRVFGDFKRFVSETQAKQPKTRIIYISAKPSPARWKLAPVFTELNNLIKSETEKDPRLLFVDVWPPMLNADGIPNEALFLDDKLHMKPEGYKIWQRTLLPAIRKGMKGNFR